MDAARARHPDEPGWSSLCRLAKRGHNYACRCWHACELRDELSRRMLGAGTGRGFIYRPVILLMLTEKLRQCLAGACTEELHDA
jgi:hypothetical protein